MNRGLKDIGLTLASRVGVLVIAVGTQTCIARMLGPAGRGSYAVATIFATTLGVICSLGIDVAVTYSVSSKRFNISEGVAYSMLFCVMSSLVAAVVGLPLLYSGAEFFQKAPASAFCLALFSIPVQLLSSALLTLLTATRSFATFALLSVSNAAAVLLLTCLFLGGLHLDVHGALLAIVLQSGLTIAAILLLLRRRYGLTVPRLRVSTLRELLGYSARYYLGKVSNVMNFHVGTIILAFYATKEDIGLFTAALALAAQVLIIPDALATVLFPRTSADVGGRPDLITRSSRFAALTSGLLLLGLACFARPVLSALFSPSFAPAAPVLRIVSAGLFVRAVSKVFVPYFLGVNRPGISSLSVLAGTTVNIIAQVLLLPLMGLNGAALALVLGYTVSATYLVVGFKKLTHMTLADIWRFRRSDFEPLSRTLGAERFRLLRASAGEHRQA